MSVRFRRGGAVFSCTDRSRMSPLWGMGRLSMKRWVSVAIVAMTLMSTTGYAADGVGVCGTIRLGETTVAMLHNAPVITLFANGAAITLLLDTGAQMTVLAPDAAERI